MHVGLEINRSLMPNYGQGQTDWLKQAERGVYVWVI